MLFKPSDIQNHYEIPGVYLLATSALINGLLISVIIYLLGERHVDWHFPGYETMTQQESR